MLRAIPHFVIVVETVEPSELISSHEAPIHLHHHAIQILSNRKQFA
jgi:hypothetical protein